ncbi:hypothetical protein PGT21_023224 [Puccinia graminis f. sp. tritici]|nr:hypothetical protein PGT21_023224 [Puccinia graminis f. sp. tritici]
MTTHCPGCLGKSRIGEERESVEPESFDHRHSPHEETINALINVVTGFILITSVHDSTQRNTLHLACLNFGLVGSKNEIEVGGAAHSDFLRLRTALLSTHLTDLKEIPHDV